MFGMFRNVMSRGFPFLHLNTSIANRVSLGLSQVCFGSLDCKCTTVLPQCGSYTLLITCILYVCHVYMYNCSLTPSMYGLSLYAIKYCSANVFGHVGGVVEHLIYVV